MPFASWAGISATCIRPTPLGTKRYTSTPLDVARDSPGFFTGAESRDWPIGQPRGRSWRFTARPRPRNPFYIIPNVEMLTFRWKMDAMHRRHESYFVGLPLCPSYAIRDTRSYDAIARSSPTKRPSEAP